jgi:BirA family biotin operon repressor/biotin-[acetyl-CoA-carboxylase] ligase
MQFVPAKKVLLSRLADGRFHSGQALGHALGLSRTAVWDLIRELESLGLEILAVRGKGYRVAHPLELLARDSIEGALSPKARQMLRVLELHDELDSTNNQLMRVPEVDKVSGHVCLAEYQTAGRGRIGRQWQSPFGGNLCLSLLWQFQDQSHIAGLSLAMGVGVVRALGRVGIQDVGLKWPNDILWKDRKLGGVLLEVSGEANGVYNVVIGIGVNVAISRQQGDSIDQPWVDLREIAGVGSIPRNRLVAGLLDELFDILCSYQELGLDRYIGEWRNHHCHHGKSARLHVGERIVAGVVAGVSDEGLLLLDTEHEGRRAYASGDLRLRVEHD